MEDLEAAAFQWRKSSRSVTQDCVEVAVTPTRVYIRHSQDHSGKFLAFSYSEWEAFTAGVRNNEFDVEVSPGS